ncbi:hypothetical protein E3P99_02429 [Wallemia hederae]|uniref:C2H2-type domain-containing protein n=1 Tax=Wallemia hederae TaxID=1540922 RepID=A0A4T0FKF6_9BASI|nr:hypothetical protein E3P99_02429 [Wallemia hederae]
MPGPSRRSRTGAAKRDIHRASRTRARTKDLDQVQLQDLLPENKAQLENQPLDETLPGLGQHYCVECARYFESDVALSGHKKTKVHRRRLKDLKQPAYTQAEADAAVGLGVDKTQPGAASKPQAIQLDN